MKEEMHSNLRVVIGALGYPRTHEHRETIPLHFASARGAVFACRLTPRPALAALVKEILMGRWTFELLHCVCESPLPSFMFET